MKSRVVERERRIVFVLGAQGSGKTTLMLELVKAARARGQVVDIVEMNGKIPGAYPPINMELWLAHRLPTLDERTRRVVPAQRKVGLLVFDDGDHYMPKQLKAGSRWEQLGLTNRHADVDVLVTGRRIQRFTEALVSGIDFLYLFQLSAADVSGIKRLALVAPDVVLPTAPYEFVRIEPKTATGNAVHGRTLSRGGYELEPTQR